MRTIRKHYAPEESEKQFYETETMLNADKTAGKELPEHWWTWKHRNDLYTMITGDDLRL